mgnify:CR=1 FL=1
MVQRAVRGGIFFTRYCVALLDKDAICVNRPHSRFFPHEKRSNVGCALADIWRSGILATEVDVPKNRCWFFGLYNDDVHGHRRRHP